MSIITLLARATYRVSLYYRHTQSPIFQILKSYVQYNDPRAFRKFISRLITVLEANIDFLHRGVNAGGYCHRSNSLGAFGSFEYQNYVWFSDEMTFRYEYIWGDGNFFLAASLRTYCYAHCYYNFVGKDRRSRKGFTI